MAREFINDCFPALLMRISVETMIYFAKIARAYESFCHATDVDLTSSTNILTGAEDLLKTAAWLCDNFSFRNLEGLRAAVEETQASLGKPWFKDVAPEEVASVKQVATAPFYTCEKGHLVSSS
jgi:DNA-binding PucR family transcriptional regulator